MTPREAFDRLTRDGDVILDRLAHWARETPDKTCIHDGEDGGRWSFAQLQARAERLAAGLAAQGVEPGDRVAVWASNGWRWVVTACGVWELGAVLVPLASRWKAPEVAPLLARSGARCRTMCEP